MPALYIFNPEHDLSLAAGNTPSYTPPAEAVKVKKKLALLPVNFAGNSDFILIPDGFSEDEIKRLEFYDIVSRKGVKLVCPKDLGAIANRIEKVEPWGWDFHLADYLKRTGIPEGLLPTTEELDRIRDLSHRRTTIPFRKAIAKRLNREPKFLPQELISLKEVTDFYKEHPDGFFKAPWSSSGHGIVVADHISEKGLMEWASGTLKRQGSIIAEPAWKRVFDFATEWKIRDGEAIFLGYSVFEASSRGKYHNNLKASQHKLLSVIEERVPNFDYRVIKAQAKALEKLVAPYYSGPAGIDMLVDEDGEINPCVEINLRLTMGMVDLW